MRKFNLETIFCPICENNSNTTFLFFDNNFKLNKCYNCELIFVSPRPSSEFIYSQYNKKEIDVFNTNYYQNYISNKAGFEFEAKNILKIITMYKPKGDLLDIGCGAGFFINYAQNHGFNVSGVELNKVFYKYAQEKLNLNIINKNLLEADFNKKYDVITMLDIMSHFAYPVDNLKKTNNLLNKGGILFIKGGNKGMFNDKISGEKWGEKWETPAHLFHYSQKSFTLLLEKTNFKLIKLISIPNVGSLITPNFIKTKKNNISKNIILKYKSLIAPGWRIFRKNITYISKFFINKKKVPSTIYIIAQKKK